MAEQRNAITHKWGDNAQSPCGLPVAMAYSTNDIGFTSEWDDVNCPACIRENGERRQVGKP